MNDKFLTAKFDNADKRFYLLGRNGISHPTAIEFYLSESGGIEVVDIGFLKGLNTLRGGATIPTTAMEEIATLFLERRGFKVTKDE